MVMGNASEFLVKEALRRKSDDDISVLVIGFRKLDENGSRSEFIEFLLNLGLWLKDYSERIVSTDAIVDDISLQ